MTRIVVVSGPTAAGKTDLALAIARAIDGELVGADSVQAGAGADPAAIVGAAALSGDGKTALFTSGDALAPTDTNGKVDLWARTLG